VSPSDQSSVPPNARPVRARTLLIAILALATVLRVANIGAHGLWHDEMSSVTSATGLGLYSPIVASGPFSAADVWARNTAGNVVGAVIWQDNGNAVLYNLLLHYWILLFGTSDGVVRALSVIAGLLVVWLVYQTTGLLFKGPVKYWAAGFTAVHPLLVHYSQETRAYALATALTLAATWFFFNLLRADDLRLRRAVLYGILAGAALLSHYLVAGILLGHGIIALLVARHRGTWVSLIVASVVASLLLGGWLGLGGWQGLVRMSRANQAYADPRTAAPLAGNFARPTTTGGMVTGLAQSAAVMTGNGLQAAGWRLREIAVLLLGPLALLIAGVLRRRSIQRTNGAVWKMAVLALTGPAVGVVLAARAGHLISFAALYMNFATPYAAILIGAGLSVVAHWNRPGRAMMGASALLQAGVVTASLFLVYADAPWRRPPGDFPRYAGLIARAAAPGDTVRYPTWTDARLCNLYLAPASGFHQRVDPSTPDIRVLRGDRELLRLPSPSPYWLTLHLGARR
jgi:4-amino-4-deoxy-L-arabinose transferase-like glycosyltransferase